MPTRGLLLGALALFAAGCGEKEESRTMEPIQLGMTKGMTAIYEDNTTSMYEVKRPVAFPIKAPTAAEQASLDGSPVAPYPSKPWLLASDLKVQVSWTITNLDEETHNVELLVDPWNEFGRYWPGMAVTNAQRQDQRPNLSGIDVLMEVPGTKDSRPSRRHGTLTYEDMKELGIDLAPAMNLILTAAPSDPGMDAAGWPVDVAHDQVGRTGGEDRVEGLGHRQVGERITVGPLVAGHALLAGLTAQDHGEGERQRAQQATQRARPQPSLAPLLRQRVEEERFKGRRGFLKHVAEEEGISVNRLKQLLKEKEPVQ